MNETLKAIMERYSCRDFCGDRLADEQVQAIVEAALAAPSAMNKMPWHIVAVTNKGLIDEMDAAAIEAIGQWEDKGLYNRITERGGKIFYNAPCMVFILSDDSNFAAVDCGIATQNVALAAHGLGLGSVICAMAKIPLDGPRGSEFKKLLKFPEGYNFGMAVCIGRVNSGKPPHILDHNKATYIN
ncbi:MAG: nitroreductase family protein [Defluviitaleaceae bacterium]|nr:nitroreductase family protein [Defluviitaleaceae bacterium]